MSKTTITIDMEMMGIVPRIRIIRLMEMITDTQIASIPTITMLQKTPLSGSGFKLVSLLLFAVDGFTMCLPLYLALQSAWKAVFITFIIGGLAQPLGGLVAYIWLRVGSAPSETVYGIIFSFTAGLMSVVAVQLLRQIPSDHKHPDLPYISMLAGIILMCLSLALTSS
ncbi:hypothetical protein ABW20_dc0104125 [Dactylellina cionopaga]|nr:hypothetical protein ABW20_dc0104125 [Dactylellina cionopaga]